MRVPYLISFYSSALLVLGGLAVDGGSYDGVNWSAVLLGLAILAIMLGVVDVVASHKRRPGGI